MYRPQKTVAESYTEQVQILCQGTMNGYNRLFGGQLMEWIDIVAAVSARRHCGKNVTTAVVDSLVFKEAAYVNDTVVLHAHVTYAGRTSMEVCVETYTEGLDDTKRLINKAYVVMVAIDESGKPTPVPELVPVSDIEKEEYDAAKKRNELRKMRRAENF